MFFMEWRRYCPELIRNVDDFAKFASFVMVSTVAGGATLGAVIGLADDLH